MAQIPADAPRSEDGQWWWDGTQWQPVGDAGVTAAASGPASGGEVNASGVPYTANAEVAAGTDMGSIDMSVDDIATILQAAGVDLGISTGAGDLVAENPTDTVA